MVYHVLRLSRRTSDTKSTAFETRLHDVRPAAVRATGVRLELHDAHAVRVGPAEESAVGHRRPDPTVDQHSDGRQGGQLGRAQGRTDAPVRHGRVHERAGRRRQKVGRAEQRTVHQHVGVVLYGAHDGQRRKRDCDRD